MNVKNESIIKVLVYFCVKHGGMVAMLLSRALLSRSWQAFIHKLSLWEAHPPLARFVCLWVKYFLHQSLTSLLSELLQKTSHCVFFLFVWRTRVHCIERKLCFTRNVESADGEGLHLLQTLLLGLGLLQFLEALGNVKSQIDESPISFTLQNIITIR